MASLLILASCATQEKKDDFDYTVESFADLEILRGRWAESGQREVSVIPYSGYEHGTEIYAFPEFAYRHGEYQEVNDYGYFDFNGTCLKTTHKTLELIDRERIGQLPEHFFADFVKVFGPNGLILLGWWTGTLFAEQLRKRQASWCFMEFTGERGAGKSTLLRLLWKMTGVTRDQEGLDPNKNSDVGFFRLMAQYSNLPIVLLEADGALGEQLVNGAGLLKVEGEHPQVPKQDGKTGGGRRGQAGSHPPCGGTDPPGVEELWTDEMREEAAV